MQTFSALRQTGAKWRRKPHFANFLSSKQCFISPISRRPISVKFDRGELVSPWILSEQNCEIFPIRDHLSSKNIILLFYGSSGTLLLRTLQPWPLGLQRIWALHLIVEEPKMFVHPVTFCVTCRFRDIGMHPLISGTPPNSLYFGYCYSVGLLVIDVIFDSLVGLNGGNVLAVTLHNLDLVLLPWHTFE